MFAHIAGRDLTLARQDGLIFWLGQTVTRIPASAFVLDENASVEQNCNIPQRRVPGTLGELGIFGRGEFSFKAIQQSVDHLALSFIYWRLAVDSFPSFCFSQNAGQTIFRPRNSPSKTTQEPFQP